MERHSIANNKVKKRLSNITKSQMSICKDSISKKIEKKTELNIFKRIKDISVITTVGDIPDSKAFFISEIKDNKELLIFGGSEVNSNKISSEVHFFDFNDGYFYSLNNISKVNMCLGLSSKLFGHSSEKTILNGEEKIIVFGGFNGKEYSNKSYMIDCDTFECFENINYSKGEIPEPRSYHTLNRNKTNNLLYMFGGWNGDVLKLNEDTFTSLWCLNTSYKIYQWEIIKPVNAIDIEINLTNKRGHTSHIINNKMYIFGGLEGFRKFTNDFITICLDEYTFAYNKMNGIEPEPRAFHCSEVINNYNIIISGGISNGEIILSDIYIVNIIYKKYTKVDVTSKEFHRFGHSIIKIPEKKTLILLGGFRNLSDFLINDNNFVNNVKKNTFLNIISIDLEFENN